MTIRNTKFVKSERRRKCGIYSLNSAKKTRQKFTAAQSVFLEVDN